MSSIACPLSSSQRDRIFLHLPSGEELTYGQVLKNVIQLECYLMDVLGVKSGEVVSSFLENTPLNIYLLLACFRQGFLYNPINPKTPLTSRDGYLEKIQPKCVVSSTSWDSGFNVYLSDLFLQNALSLKDVTPHEVDIQSNRAFLIIFSSGSISFPKAVVLSAGNIQHSSSSSNKIIPLQEGDVWDLSLPLFHISGISVVMRCVLSGVAVGVGTQRGNIVSWVPTQLRRHLENGEGSQNFKAILIGGAFCPADVLREALERKLPIYYSYGMTEMSSQIYTKRMLLRDGEISEEGFLLNGLDLKLSDGEIWVKGQTLFLGYFQKGVLEKKLEADGFFATGDLGIWQSGVLQVVGRKDNLFISGGENIQPEFVEKTILSLGDFQAVIVLPREDLEFGEVPVVFLFPACEDALVLKEKLKNHLPPFMIPKQFYTIPEVLLCERLKISRQKLKKYLTDELI